MLAIETGFFSSSTTPSHSNRSISLPHVKESGKAHRKEVGPAKQMDSPLEILKTFKSVLDDSISPEVLAKRLLQHLGYLTVEQDKDEGIIEEPHSPYGLPAGAKSRYKPCPIDVHGRARSPTPPPPEVPTYPAIVQRVNYPGGESRDLPIKQVKREVERIKRAKARAEVYGTIPDIVPAKERTYGAVFVKTLSGPCALPPFEGIYEENLVSWMNIVNTRRRRDGVEDMVTLGPDENDDENENNHKGVKRKFWNEEAEEQNHESPNNRLTKKLRTSERTLQPHVQSTSIQRANPGESSQVKHPWSTCRSEIMPVAGPSMLQLYRRYLIPSVDNIRQFRPHSLKSATKSKDEDKNKDKKRDYTRYEHPQKHRRVEEFIRHARAEELKRLRKPTFSTSASTSLSSVSFPRETQSPESASCAPAINIVTSNHPSCSTATGFFDQIECSIQ